jgi:two-component system CheB/CheR fusion protein
MLSHELRNPLASIVASIQLLRTDDIGPPERGKALTVLQRQARHMSRLLDDLLEISRIRNGKVPVLREPLDLAAVARDVLETLEPRLAPYGFRADIAPGPIWIEGDAHRLQQLLVNLLTNAMKFTPSGGAVRLEVRAEPGAAAVVVRDEGRGIPADALGRIFEPFVQVEGGPNADGMGLGLALARTIVEAHGGAIAAHSDGPDRGSEFTVRLPLGRAPVAVSVPSASPERLVVVVEDQDDTRELVCALLTRRGFEVVGACDGREALRTIAERSPRVALVDVGLPGLSGLEVARRLCAEMGERRPFLIAVTGYGQDHDRDAVREAGFDRHIVKPFELDQLIGVLSEVIPPALPAPR